MSLCPRSRRIPLSQHFPQTILVWNCGKCRWAKSQWVPVTSDALDCTYSNGVCTQSRLWFVKFDSIDAMDSTVLQSASRLIVNRRSMSVPFGSLFAYDRRPAHQWSLGFQSLLDLESRFLWRMKELLISLFVILSKTFLIVCQEWNISLSPESIRGLSQWETRNVSLHITTNNLNTSLDNEFELVLATEQSPEYPRQVMEIREQNRYLFRLSETEPTFSSHFQIKGLFLGYSNVSFTLYWNKSFVQTLDNFSVSVVRKTSIFDMLFGIIIISLVTVNYVNMGCHLDLRVVRETLKRPIGPAIGFVCQFTVMPLVSRVLFDRFQLLIHAIHRLFVAMHDIMRLWSQLLTVTHSHQTQISVNRFLQSLSILSMSFSCKTRILSIRFASLFRSVFALL